MELEYQGQNPEGWEVYDHLSSEVAMGQLLYGFVRMLRPELVIETGCYGGLTTRMLGQACLENKKGRVITSDINPEAVDRTIWRTTSLPVEVRLCPSLAMPELPEADFIFSDSDNPSRMKEYELAKSGCIYILHDTNEVQLGAFMRSIGGICFPCGRGFGLKVK